VTYNVFGGTLSLTQSINLPPFLLFLSSLPIFLHSLCVPSLSQGISQSLGSLRSAVSVIVLVGPGGSPADKQYLVRSVLKITHSLRGRVAYKAHKAGFSLTKFSFLCIRNKAPFANKVMFYACLSVSCLLPISRETKLLIGYRANKLPIMIMHGRKDGRTNHKQNASGR